MPCSSGESAPWRLEEELRIGSVDGGGPTTFGELKALVVDSTCRIIVLESRKTLQVHSRGALLMDG